MCYIVPSRGFQLERIVYSYSGTCLIPSVLYRLAFYDLCSDTQPLIPGLCFEHFWSSWKSFIIYRNGSQQYVKRTLGSVESEHSVKAFFIQIQSFDQDRLQLNHINHTITGPVRVVHVIEYIGVSIYLFFIYFIFYWSISLSKNSPQSPINGFYRSINCRNDYWIESWPDLWLQ